MNKTIVGELFKVMGGGTPPTSTAAYWDGDIPWITSADIDEQLNVKPRKYITKKAINNSATNLVPAGSVIVVTRVGLGKVAIAPFDLCFSQDCQALLLDHSKYDTKYMAYQLKKAVGIFKHISRGTTISGVTKKQLLDLEIIVPSIDEQKQIVAEIEKQFTRLDAGVAALKRLQINLKRYRAAVLKAACEGRLVPTEAELARQEGREYEPASVLLDRILNERREKWMEQHPGKKYVEPKGPDTSNLPELPEGWCWGSVEQISTKVVDGVHKKPNYVNEGIPFVTVRNLTAGIGISFDNLNYITLADHEEFIKRAHPERSDILITKDGTLGIIRQIKTEKKFSIFVSVAMIKPVMKDLSDFLTITLSSPQVQIQMVPKGSGLQHIHLEDLREDCIPMAPLVEQKRIVFEVERRISVIEELESAAEANLKRTDRLRQAVLQRAFENNNCMRKN